MLHPSPSLTKAAIAILITLKIIMLVSMFSGVQPHPPFTFILGGMGPFLGTAIACLIAAAICDPLKSWAGRIFAGVALVCALLTFGPQKYFDAQWPLIWPAVLAAQAAILILTVQMALGLRKAETSAAQHAIQGA